jgi:ADP-ribose pyrophosphatase
MSKIIKSIYKGRIVDLRIERHRLPKGVAHDYEVVRHVPAAAVLPIHQDHVLLIKQYRAPLAQYIWEIPAGLLDKGETPLACAKRELIEETGFRGKRFRKFADIYTAAGFCDEVISLYQCELGKQVGTAHEGSEVISVHFFSIDQVKQMIGEKRINDAKTLVALQWYVANIKNETTRA